MRADGGNRGPPFTSFQATSARRILVVDLDIVWPGGRLLPTLVFEEDDGVVAILLELPNLFLCRSIRRARRPLAIARASRDEAREPSCRNRRPPQSGIGALRRLCFPLACCSSTRRKDLRAWSMPYRYHPGTTI